MGDEVRGDAVVVPVAGVDLIGDDKVHVIAVVDVVLGGDDAVGGGDHPLWRDEGARAEVAAVAAGVGEEAADHLEV
ncbi:MAG: hypothetical protein IPN01_07580 [Deltaproteobacteria bacterium]|nr:hypothetical protein [Deltaproteobacteria bacterium]